MRTYRHYGFTLIEMMITVVIIGILASIAIPAYDSYVRRGKVQEATSTLADMRVRLEQYYQDNRNYGSTAAVCGIPVPASPAVKYFSYTCTQAADGPNADTNQSFIVTATGRAAQGMSGYTYTINERNIKASSLPNGSTANGCWISKEGEAC